MRYFPTRPETCVKKTEFFIESAALKQLCVQYAPTDSPDPYQVTTNKEQDHEWGHGGYHEDTTRLLKGDQPLILSVNYVSWDTTSDDSTDYDRLKERWTYLLYDDPVAQKIFDALCVNSLPP